MVLYNAATKELTAKIVYYGPGLGGKTTNLQLLHDRLDQDTVGKLLTLSTQTDRTIYFDLLPVELGEIKGYRIRFQLATVPGQTAFNETRKVVLRGADGIVFVADSRWAMLPKNLESWQNLKENLKEIGLSFETIPIVVQYNKRDLSDILSVEAMQEALGLSSYPFAEAVASAGRGITETFKLISKLTFVDLMRRLQGRKPDETGPAAGWNARAVAAPTLEKPPASEAPAPPEASSAAEAESAGPRRETAAPEATASAEEVRPSGFEAGFAAIAADQARQAQEQARLGGELTDAAAKIEALERRLDAQEHARQSAERTASAAHESLSARAEKLFQEIAAALRRIEDLESSLQEKSSQGRREAEDIRAQIAPLLEAEGERRASDRKAFAELERLRESLADSLAEVAERLRKAVREL